MPSLGGDKPGRLAEKARKWIALGRADKALAVADRGLAVWPASDELREIVRFCRRLGTRDRVAVCRRELDADPTFERHVALARAQMESEDEGGAIRTAEAAAERFPDEPRPVLLVAELLFARFRRDRAASDGKAAIAALRHAVELAPGEAAYGLSLARRLVEIGALAEARREIDTILAADPDHAEAGALRQEIEPQPDAPPPEDVSIDILLRRIEDAASAPVTAAPNGAEADPPDENLRRRFATLTAIEGECVAALLSNGRTLVAARGEIAPDDDPALKAFAQMAGELRSLLAVSARRIGLGSFTRAELCREDRLLQAVDTAVAVLAIETPLSVRRTALEEAIRRLLSGQKKVAAE